MVANRGGYRPTQFSCGCTRVAAAAVQRRRDLLAAELELAVQQGQEQFILGFEVRVDRTFGEARGLTDGVDGGTGEPFGGEYLRGRVQDPVRTLAAGGAGAGRLDRRHEQQANPPGRPDTVEY